MKTAEDNNPISQPNMDKLNPGQNLGSFAEYFDTTPDGQFDTLDEPISKTIFRDIKMVCHKLKYVLIPRFREEQGKALREWDLFGPLLFSLVLAIVLSFSTEDNDNIFATLSAIIFGGSLIVTLNCNLLGGNAHILQCLCVLGYCIFPIVLASLSIVVFKVIIDTFLLKSAIVGFAFLWSSTSSVAFMSSMIDPEKKALSVFPVVLFYLFISWFCLFI